MNRCFHTITDRLNSVASKQRFQPRVDEEKKTHLLAWNELMQGNFEEILLHLSSVCTDRSQELLNLQR